MADAPPVDTLHGGDPIAAHRCLPPWLQLSVRPVTAGGGLEAQPGARALPWSNSNGSQQGV